MYIHHYTPECATWSSSTPNRCSSAGWDRCILICYDLFAMEIRGRVEGWEAYAHWGIMACTSECGLLRRIIEGSMATMSRTARCCLHRSHSVEVLMTGLEAIPRPPGPGQRPCPQSWQPREPHRCGTRDRAQWKRLGSTATEQQWCQRQCMHPSYAR